MTDLKAKLIPYPQKVSEIKGIRKLCSLNSAYSINYCKDSGAVLNYGVDYLTSKLTAIGALKKTNEGGAFVIDIELSSSVEHLEGYTLEINADSILLKSQTEAGALYGIYTLCQLFFVESGTVCLPMVSIEDYPDFADRSQFAECRYGSDFMTKEQWFDMLSYFSEMKYNKVVIGLYGCWPVQYDGELQEYLYIPFKKHPELTTPRSIKYYSPSKKEYVIKENVLPTMFEEDFFGDLIEYGAKMNIKVIPMFNSLGHNTLIPRVHPELSAKDENGVDTGFGVCTESDATIEFMSELYDEIIDRYLVPNDIHSITIGLDEVLDSMGIDKNNLKKKFSYLCRCEKCRQFEEKELMIRYIIRLSKHLISRGMKDIYIYQDMLFYDYDVINEELKTRFIEEGIYDNVVINWWSYDVEDKLFRGRSDELNNIFRSIIMPMTGYFHWSYPTETNQNIYENTMIADKLGYEGVRTYTGFDYCYDKNFRYQADVTWNKSMLEYKDFEKRYAPMLSKNNSGEAYTALCNMKKVMLNDHKDNKFVQYMDVYMHTYINPDKPYPRSWPGDVYTEITSKRDEYIPYLTEIYTKAKSAYDIFNSSCDNSYLCDVWKLSAMQYYVSANEFLRLTSLYDEYQAGSIDEFTILSEIEKLIASREELMFFGEKIKISGNSYHYLRDMTIYRQYLIDIRDYVKKCISDKQEVIFDITNLTYLKSDIYDYLR